MSSSEEGEEERHFQEVAGEEGEGEEEEGEDEEGEEEEIGGCRLLVRCDECGKQCKGRQGIAAHRRLKHGLGRTGPRSARSPPARRCSGSQALWNPSLRTRRDESGKTTIRRACWP